MTDQPLNRAQRRAAEFRPEAGKPDPHDVLGNANVDTGAEAAAGALPADADADAAQAHTRSGSGDVTLLTGAGTGGATESDDRMPNHEGAHYGNQPNS